MEWKKLLKDLGLALFKIVVSLFKGIAHVAHENPMATGIVTLAVVFVHMLGVSWFMTMAIQVIGLITVYFIFTGIPSSKKNTPSPKKKKGK